MTSSSLSTTTRRQKQEKLARNTAEIARRNSRRYLFTLFPDKGPLARHLYQKHLEFFRAGKYYRERCFMAANRIGKTIGAGYELTVHLTGLYPHWWEGRRFSRPINAWAAGKTNKKTREILQRKLLGQITGAGTSNKSVDGTGLIPGDNLGRPSWNQNIADFIDTIQVLHKPTGGYSTLGFKSYKEGAGGFEGTEQQVIMLDEEPGIDVYGECLIRTAGNIAVPDSSGIIMLSFTPKLGLSDVVLSFMPKEERPGFGDEVRTELG